MKTASTKAQDITRKWHIVDAKGQVLGRIAVEIAHKLMGKGKPYFVRNMDCGDYVVVINVKDSVVTGRKEAEKTYGRYSGYPGGLKKKTLRQVKNEKPTEPMRNAVYGMLPKNKIRDRLITRLYIYADDKHPHADKINN